MTYSMDISTHSERSGDRSSPKVARALCLGISKAEREYRVSRDDQGIGPALSMFEWEDRTFTQVSFEEKMKKARKGTIKEPQSPTQVTPLILLQNHRHVIL